MDKLYREEIEEIEYIKEKGIKQQTVAWVQICPCCETQVLVTPCWVLPIDYGTPGNPINTLPVDQVRRLDLKFTWANKEGKLK